MPRIPDFSPDVQQALRILEQGGLVLLPMDTLYGIAARADLPAAVKRLRSWKNRPANKALAILCPDLDWAFKAFDPAAADRAFLQALLPGPVTAVLPAWGPFCKAQPFWKESVGIRLPGPCACSALMQESPWPLALSSANFSGAATALREDELDESFCRGLDFRFPGQLQLGQPSTVVDLRYRPPRILRQGALSAAEVAVKLEQQ